MTQIINRSIFDLLKVGIGPSSSHTLAPMKMALDFRKHLIQKNIIFDEIELILKGSFGFTGESHMTPNALIAGLVGLDPVLSPIKKIKSATKDLLDEGILNIGLNYIKVLNRDFIKFSRNFKDLKHPNTCQFIAYLNGQKIVDCSYLSPGGGVILLESDFELQTEDTSLNKSSFSEILIYCKENKISLLELIYAQEESLTGVSRVEIIRNLEKIWYVMESAIKNSLKEEGILEGGLKLERRAKKSLTRLSSNTDKWRKLAPGMGLAGIYALAVSEENASGGRIITAPTCGASGLVPGVLYMLKDSFNLTNRDMSDALAIASLVGNIVVDRASISGAEVGCQGEVGVACSMGAALCTFLSGGSDIQIEMSAESALEHYLGLTCDPIKGLVQIPCIERNAVGAGTAINTSYLIMSSDEKHLISFDSCVDTMMRTGKDMSYKYKETSEGGLAETYC
ncbi:MAG: L-serine ammonia-lyase [Candidatus Cloacimonadota bacterium]|nr:MAG: L-serine ammonia-lyase [Candidatus Cloacimonadota bacterium]